MSKALARARRILAEFCQIVRSIYVCKRSRINAESGQFPLLNDFRIGFHDEPLNGEFAGVDSPRDIRCQVSSNSQTQREASTHPASRHGFRSGQQPITQQTEEVGREKREIDSREDIRVPIRYLKGGEDTAQGAFPRYAVRKLAASDNLNRVCRRQKQLRHVFQQRNGAPLQHGFVATHSAALPSREDEPVR